MSMTATSNNDSIDVTKRFSFVRLNQYGRLTPKFNIYRIFPTKKYEIYKYFLKRSKTVEKIAFTRFI